MKTPQQSYPDLAKALGVAEIYLKREDLHPYGSHKGRSLPLMIKEYTKKGIRHFVISSSGNAALAAAISVAQHNKNNPGKEISLAIYVGNHIDLSKLQKLSGIQQETPHITLEQKDKPKQTAFQAEKNAPETTRFLRQSTDDLALEGYISLAEELNKIPNLQAIFIPTSSGTTAEAVGQTFQKLEQSPQIHIVQTTACHPIAEALGAILPEPTLDNSEQTQSEARAIVDNIAHRKQAVADVVKQSNGSGWIVSDNEIKDAIDLVKKTTNIDMSPNSVLSVAGLKKAVENGFVFAGPVVCLITGQ